MTVMRQAARLAMTLLCAGGLAGCGESPSPAMATAPGAATHGQFNRPGGQATGPALNTTNPPSSPGEAAAPAEPAVPSEALVSAVRSRSGPPVRIADISFDDLKFEMVKTEPFEQSMLTDKINALDGRSVRIRGYILPSFQQSGLTQFVLVRDNLSCCFGPGAALYDCIVVDMQPGKSTDFSISPVTVEGTFSIRELLDSEGKALAIYHLDGESVR